MDVIGMTVELQAMMTDNLSKGKHIEDEDEWTKHQSLGDTLRQGSVSGDAVIYADELLPVGEVGVNPGQS